MLGWRGVCRGVSRKNISSRVGAQGEIDEWGTAFAFSGAYRRHGANALLRSPNVASRAIQESLDGLAALTLRVLLPPHRPRFTWGRD